MTTDQNRRSGDEPALGGAETNRQDIHLGGEAAVLHLVEMLSHDDSAVRARALFGLAELGDHRAIEGLLTLIHNRRSSFSVHIRAAKALWINFNDKRGLDYLLDVSLCGNKESAQVEANRALAGSGDVAMEQLIAALTNESWLVRAHAATALAAFRDERTTAPLIAAFGSEVRVNQKIQQALVDIGVPAIEPLTAHIRHHDKDIRAWAIMTLGEIGDTRTVEPLMASIPSPDSWTHRQAILALAKIGDRRATPLIINTLNHPDSSVRGSAMQALKLLQDPQAVEPLSKMLQDSDPMVRQEAAQSLSAFGERATEHLIPILENDTSGTVRVITASILGSIGDPQAIDPLIAAMKDESLVIRQHAVEALGKIGAKNVEAIRVVIKPICEALKDRNLNIKRAAASALAEIGQDHPGEAADAVPPLLTALQRSHHPAVYIGIIYALGKIGDSRAVEPLIERLLTHLHGAHIGEVTRWAAWALGEIGDERAVEPLTTLLNSYSHLGARSAATALGKIGGEQATRSLSARLERYGLPVSKRTLGLIIGNAEGWFGQDYWDWDRQDLEALMIRTVIEALEMIGTPEALAAFED